MFKWVKGQQRPGLPHSTKDRETKASRSLKATFKRDLSVSAQGVGRGEKGEPLSATNPESADSKNKNHTS